MSGQEIVLPVRGTELARPFEVDGRLRFATRAQRDAAIVELARQDIAPAEIERRIVVARGTIYGVLAAARHEGKGVPYFSTSGKAQRPPTPAIKIALDPFTQGSLTAEAKTRGISVNALVEQLVTQLVDDDLVDTVLRGIAV